MIHLTYTGSLAGRPFCTNYQGKIALIEKGDTFSHYATLYNVTDKELIKDERYCSDCRNVLKESLEELTHR